ncbi:MAG: ABC transporter permease [Candidatus Porifericomitaceae bacterium WSBS_2022_MAG_OTU9]
MIAYTLRRIAYAVPVLVGVNLLTFMLFFVVNSPDDVARMQIGAKVDDQAAIENWKSSHGYDKPLFYNADAEGYGRLTETLFFSKSLRLFLFDFGRSDSGRDISNDIRQRMMPSLMIAVPTLVLGLILNISFALLLALYRGSLFDKRLVAICVLMMSISSLFYTIGGQYVAGYVLRLTPISGYIPGELVFLLMPVLVSVAAGFGSGSRWYRAIFVEEIGRDYVRAARARGLGEASILFRHVLVNGMIPILTGVVVIVPLLFMGSLLVETFFAVPGLGSYTLDAILLQDFSILRCMVFLGSLLYIIGLLLTDLSYVLVDPRVRLQDADA